MILFVKMSPDSVTLTLVTLATRSVAGDPHTRTPPLTPDQCAMYWVTWSGYGRPARLGKGLTMSWRMVGAREALG